MLNAIVMRVGSTATTFELSMQVQGEENPRILTRQLAESSVLRDYEIAFESRLSIRQLYITIKNTNDPEPGHVHLWEVTFK